jgi:succinate dehydrogenase / fumarate reductase flavoprotein subunit
MREVRPVNNCCSAPYQALERQVAAGTVTMFPRTEMLDLGVVNGHAKGIVVRNLITGAD